jgi:hypothetical protein
MSGWLASATAFLDDTFDQVVAKVNEAQSEIASEQEKFATSIQASSSGTSDGELLLPWETDQEDLQILSNDVMERILKLSVTEENFTEIPQYLNDKSIAPTFNFQTFVPIALRLMELDPNLARMHAKLMPHMNEEDFWSHYHFRIMYTRATVGLDGEAIKAGPLGSLEEDQIPIFQPAHIKAHITHNSSATNIVDTSTEVDLTEEQQEELTAKKRRDEEAALAAEVEAELLGEDLDLDDLDDMSGADLDDLDDLDALEELEAEENASCEQKKGAESTKSISSNMEEEDTDDIDNDLGGLSMDDLDAAIEAELLSPSPKK